MSNERWFHWVDIVIIKPKINNINVKRSHTELLHFYYLLFIYIFRFSDMICIIWTVRVHVCDRQSNANIWNKTNRNSILVYPFMDLDFEFHLTGVIKIKTRVTNNICSPNSHEIMNFYHLTYTNVNVFTYLLQFLPQLITTASRLKRKSQRIMLTIF